MKVAQVMTRQVAAVRPETPLRDVAALMVSKGISGVPVVGDDGSVLGVVSEADFVIKERGPEAVHHRLLARVFGESRQTRAENSVFPDPMDPITRIRREGREKSKWLKGWCT